MGPRHAFLQCSTPPAASGSSARRGALGKWNTKAAQANPRDGSRGSSTAACLFQLRASLCLLNWSGWTQFSGQHLGDAAMGTSAVSVFSKWHLHLLPRASENLSALWRSLGGVRALEISSDPTTEVYGEWQRLASCVLTDARGCSSLCFVCFEAMFNLTDRVLPRGARCLEL